MAQLAAKADLPLDRLVVTFFRTDDASPRTKLALQIEEAAEGSVEGSVEAVRAALKKASFWTPLPSTTGEFNFQSDSGKRIDVVYFTPPDYDPDRAYPVLLCQPSAGISAGETLRLAGGILPVVEREFILVAPERMVARFYHDPPNEAADLKNLLREVRRRIHTDTDRTFLFGVAEGGDAAWMAAISRPDDFAGVITVSSSPPLPHPRELFSVLLANLRGLPVMSVWTSVEPTAEATRPAMVAAHNRYLVELSRSEQLPIVGVELAAGADPLIAFPRTQASEFLGRRRAAPPHEFTLTFRYPANGEGPWLRATTLHEPRWEAEQLAILSSSQVDRHGFVRHVLVQHLARFRARIDGPNLTVDAWNVRRLELFLEETAFEPGAVLTVGCNGTVRFRGRLEPKVSVLLENAYETWDFQRLPAVRIPLTVESETHP